MQGKETWGRTPSVLGFEGNLSVLNEEGERKRRWHGEGKGELSKEKTNQSNIGCKETQTTIVTAINTS